MRFEKLATYGIAASHLQDACAGRYLAAWMLAKAISSPGNTWFGVAANYSATPSVKRRYQVHLKANLIEHEFLHAFIESVPSLKLTASLQTNSASDTPLMAFPVSHLEAIGRGETADGTALIYQRGLF